MLVGLTAGRACLHRPLHCKAVPQLSVAFCVPRWLEENPDAGLPKVHITITTFWRYSRPSAIVSRNRCGLLRRRKAPTHPALLPCPPRKCHSMYSTHRPGSRSGSHAPHEMNVPEQSARSRRADNRGKLILIRKCCHPFTRTRRVLVNEEYNPAKPWNHCFPRPSVEMTTD